MSFTAAATLVEHHLPDVALSTKLFATEQLISGAMTFCPDCGFFADASSPCEVCMMAAAQADAYDAKMANAEYGEYGCDPYARF